MPDTPSAKGAPTGHERTVVDNSTDVGHAPTVGTGEQPRVPVASAAVGAPGDLKPGTMVGEYRIEGKLGEGGMGEVFAAIHPLIGKRAAVKVIRPEACANAAALERFVQEARSVNQIGHSNIVDVFAFGTLPDGRSYFVMEWLKGESLAARMRRGRLGLEECRDILDPVTRALDAAHEKRIIHRDLKPDNIFLVTVKGEKPIVKLLDFGIAKLVGNEDTRLERTRTGSLLGTPQYISPEQARGREVDERTDIYSLGATAFEMLTGRPPFVGESAMDVVASHLHDAPPRPSSVAPGLPAGVDALILAMLDKEPARRPPLARVREALAELRGSPAATAERAAIVPAPRRRARLAVIPLVVLLAGAATIAVVVGKSRGGGEGESTVASAPAPTTPAPTPAAPTPPPATPPPATAPPVAAPAVTPGTLVVSVANADDARVTVDGREVPVAKRRARVEVDPGPHEVVVTAEGRKPYQVTVVVHAGESSKIRVRLDRERRGGGTGRPAAGTSTDTPPPTPTPRPHEDEDEGTLDPFKGEGR